MAMHQGPGYIKDWFSYCFLKLDGTLGYVNVKYCTTLKTELKVIMNILLTKWTEWNWAKQNGIKWWKKELKN